VSDHVETKHRDARGKVFAKVLNPKVPSWPRLRKLQKVSEHVRVSLIGEADTVTCIECGEVQELRGVIDPGAGGVPPEQVLDNFMRKHFERHKLINKFC